MLRDQLKETEVTQYQPFILSEAGLPHISTAKQRISDTNVSGHVQSVGFKEGHRFQLYIKNYDL